MAAEELRYDYLLFFSNFNGTWNQYIDAFSAVLYQGLNLIWMWSEKFPGSVPVTPVQRVHLPRPVRHRLLIHGLPPRHRRTTSRPPTSSRPPSTRSTPPPQPARRRSSKPPISSSCCRCSRISERRAYRPSSSERKDHAQPERKSIRPHHPLADHRRRERHALARPPNPRIPRESPHRRERPLRTSALYPPHRGSSSWTTSSTSACPPAKST